MNVNSVDKSLMEKVRLVEALSDEEKKVVFSIVGQDHQRVNEAHSGTRRKG